MSNLVQLTRGLFPPPPRTSERGKLLDACLRERCTRAWITRGCYAWWRYSDYLKAAQLRLLAHRRATTGEVAS